MQLLLLLPESAAKPAMLLGIHWLLPVSLMLLRLLLPSLVLIHIIAADGVFCCLWTRLPVQSRLWWHVHSCLGEWQHRSALSARL
jgi:hypothetical protein